MINEAHYEDIYPKQFTVFRKKYLKIKSRYHLYVQFSNHADNTLQKSAYDSPNHSDPVGIYGYPLDYVLKHPADIWYGKNAKFLRVLESKNTGETLDLQYDIRTQDEAVNILFKMGYRFNEAEKLLKRASKAFRHKAPNKWAKCFLSVVQMEKFGDDGEEKKVRPGREQTALFKKAGYKAIRDTAKTAKKAVMNDREPEQIVFLTRDMFDVIDVYTLQKPTGEEAYLNEPGVGDEYIKKIAKQVAFVIGDTITEGPETSNLGGWKYFWTKKGRRIEVMTAKPSNYYENIEKKGYTFSMSKPHRYSKLSSHEETWINVRSERGEFERHFMSDEKIKDMLSEVSQDWRELDNASDWQPETKDSFLEKEKQKRIKQYEERRKQERLEMLADYERTKGVFDQISDKLGVPKVQLDTDEEKTDFVQAVDTYIPNIFKRAFVKDDIEATITNFKESFDHAMDEFDAATRKRMFDTYAKVIQKLLPGNSYIQYEFSPYWILRKIEETNDQ